MLGFENHRPSRLWKTLPAIQGVGGPESLPGRALQPHSMMTSHRRAESTTFEERAGLDSNQ